MAIDWGTEFGGNSPQQSDSAVSAIENNPEVAAQSAAIDRLQRAKDITKRQIDQMGQTSSETPGGIFGRKWSYGGKVYTDQQLADAKSAVDRAQNDDEIYQAIRNLANANDQSEVGTGVGGMLARGMNNTPIASIGNNSFLGNNRTKYEYPEDDSSWAYTIGKYGGGGLELASDLSGAGDVLKMAKAARFNPFTFAGMLYRDAKQTGKDIVNLPGNIVNGIRNAGSKTSDFVKDSIKAGTEGKSLKAYRTPASAGETAQTGGRAAETAAPATERTAASETAAPAAERTVAPAPERTAPQQPAPAPERTAPQQPAPAPERTAPQQPAPAPRQETAPAEGLPELRANADGTPDIAGTINIEGREAAVAGEQAAGREAAAAGEQAAGREAAADGGVSELANAANAGRGAAGADAATGAAGTAGSGAIDSTTMFLIKQIKTGKLDDLERAWINALADKGVRNPQSLSASEQALVDNARAAGILDDAAAGAARGASQGTVAGAGSKARWDEIPDANGMTRSRADEVLAREEIRRYDPRTTREGIASYIEDDLKTLAGKPGYETPYQAFQTLMSQWGKYNPNLGQDPYNYIWRLAVRMFE